MLVGTALGAQRTVKIRISDVACALFPMPHTDVTWRSLVNRQNRARPHRTKQNILFRILQRLPYAQVTESRGRHRCSRPWKPSNAPQLAAGFSEQRASQLAATNPHSAAPSTLSRKEPQEARAPQSSHGSNGGLNSWCPGWRS